MKISFYSNTTVKFIIKNAAYKNQRTVLIPLHPAFILYFKIFANISLLQVNKQNCSSWISQKHLHTCCVNNNILGFSVLLRDGNILAKTACACSCSLQLDWVELRCLELKGWRFLLKIRGRDSHILKFHST